jgi:hypothetical protein
MRLADNAAGSVQKERPFVDVLQLGYLRDDMIRTVQSFILIGRTLFFSVAERR